MSIDHDRYLNEKFDERYYESREGLKLYYRVYESENDSPYTVLCLPGLTRNSRDFHHIGIMLRNRFNVVCPDYRGRGQSEHDPNWKNYKAMTYIRDLFQLIKIENMKKIIILGTSMGGLIGLGIGYLRPFRTQGILINDIGPELATGGFSRILDYLGQDDPQKDWDSAVKTLQERFPNMAFQNQEHWKMFARCTFVEREDGLLHFDWDTNIITAMRNEKDHIPNLWRLYRGCRRYPMMLLHGEKSDLLTTPIVDKMVIANPNLDVVTIPGASHAPSLLEIEAIDAVKRFMNQFTEE